MKNHYQILNISPGASGTEIEEAFRRAKDVYSENSVAIYSLYSSEERKAMLREVAEAYETLSDPLKKSAYDRSLSVHHEGTGEVDINALMDNKADDNRISGAVILEKNHETRRVKKVTSLKEPPVVMDGAEDPMVAEQYRILYAKMEQISLKNSYKTFAVTSAVKDEGKSTTALNLSYVMANEFKKRTLLVECDLRKPSSVLGLLEDKTGGGLAEALRGEVDLHSAIRRIEGTNLYILPAGAHTKQSAELLGSAKLKAALNTLKTEFDFVIVDSPPLLPMVDMDIISRLVDGIIVVVMSGKTPKDLVVKAVNSISSGNVVGIVLNAAESSLKHYYY